MSTDIKLWFCTCPDANTANEIARALVNEGLAACVNILPGVTSIYAWQNEVHEDPELLLLIKSAANPQQLQQFVSDAHPYESPELIAADINAGLPDYLQWVVEQSQ